MQGDEIGDQKWNDNENPGLRDGDGDKQANAPHRTPKESIQDSIDSGVDGGDVVSKSIYDSSHWILIKEVHRISNDAVCQFRVKEIGTFLGSDGPTDCSTHEANTGEQAQAIVNQSVVSH